MVVLWVWPYTWILKNECTHFSSYTHTHPFNGPSCHPTNSVKALKALYMHTHTQTHTHTRSTALFPGLPRWAGTRKVKPILILLKQETVSGSGISWAICKSAPRSRQITTPAPHHSVFTGLMPFLPPNQLQSTEGTGTFFQLPTQLSLITSNSILYKITNCNPVE